MKILYFADDFPPLSFGGAGVVAYNLARETARQNHQVFVITTVQKRSQERKEDVDGITLYRIYSKYPRPFLFKSYISLYNPLTVRKVKKIIKDIKPDVVHAHNIHSHLSYHVLKLAKKIGAKVFLTAHDVMLVSYGKAFFKPDEKNFKIGIREQTKIARKGYNPLRNIIIKHYLKYVDKIFAVSEALKRVLEDNGIGNLEVIHNGIDIDSWAVSEEDIEVFKNKFNLKDKKIIFWGGGRLTGAKGAIQILKAFEIIIKGYKARDAVLVIAGDKGFYADKMEKMVEDFGIGSQVIFTGRLDIQEMKSAFASCDVSVAPSICFDSFPTVNLEAMAAKKPVVATCFGGSSEIVLNNETGYILNPNDENLLAEKIIDLLHSPEKTKAFGLAGYERVKDHFSLKHQAQKILDVLKPARELDE